MTRLILALALLAAALAPGAAHAAPGSVTLVGPSSSDPAWASTHYWRTLGTTPGERAWVRRSAYALDAATAAAHPDWILKSVSQPLYVGGALAADFGNPDYRAWWIGEARAAVAGGAGLYVDDMTMERRTVDSYGFKHGPTDPRTGRDMTLPGWQRYMADFMTELRAALPSAEIIHDFSWKVRETPDVTRALDAASGIALEQGFNDPKIMYACCEGQWDALVAFVERHQAAGQSVILDSSAEDAGARLYGLATALLLDTGRVALVNDAWSGVARYWSGYDLDLGEPLGARRVWGVVWRRDFERGFVIVNPPDGHVWWTNLNAGAMHYGRLTDPDGVELPTDFVFKAGSAVVVHVVPWVTSTPTPTPTPTSTWTPPRTSTWPEGVEVPWPPPLPVSPDVTPMPAVPAPAELATLGPRRPAPARAPAGAAVPKTTTTTVTLRRTSVSGVVKSAINGFARVTVQRKRGNRWVTVRRAKDSVSKRGQFHNAIKPLSRGTYRVIAVFEGTGTAQPSKSGYAVRTI